MNERRSARVPRLLELVEKQKASSPRQMALLNGMAGIPLDKKSKPVTRKLLYLESQPKALTELASIKQQGRCQIASRHRRFAGMARQAWSSATASRGAAHGRATGSFRERQGDLCRTLRRVPSTYWHWIRWAGTAVGRLRLVVRQGGNANQDRAPWRWWCDHGGAQGVAFGDATAAHLER